MLLSRPNTNHDAVGELLRRCWMMRDKKNPPIQDVHTRTDGGGAVGLLGVDYDLLG